jgi:hypothetical protein
MHDPLALPDDLPVPADDGATRHLTGIRIHYLHSRQLMGRG